MMRKFLAVLALISSPAVAAGYELVDADTEIMIGRTEVMHDQTLRGLAILGVAGARDDEFVTAPNITPYRRLAVAVERYNALRDAACRSRAILNPLCGGAPFLPLWYAGRARPDLSPEGLKHMAEDVQTRTVPLWSAVCERARTRVRDETLCAIE